MCNCCNNNPCNCGYDNQIINVRGTRGPIGPTGPQGPAGPPGTASLDSILVDNDGTQTVASDGLADLGEIINSTGTSISFTAPNTVTVNAGTYFILFESLIANSTSSGDVGASMLINGVVANNASEYVPATTTQTQIALTHSLTVTEPTNITITNSSDVENLFHDTSLFVLKIG